MVTDFPRRRDLLGLPLNIYWGGLSVTAQEFLARTFKKEVGELAISFAVDVVDEPFFVGIR